MTNMLGNMVKGISYVVTLVGWHQKSKYLFLYTSFSKGILINYVMFKFRDSTSKPLEFSYCVTDREVADRNSIQRQRHQDSNTDRGKDSKTDEQTEGKTARQTNRQREGQQDRHTDREKDAKTDTQTRERHQDRYTDRGKDTKTDTQTEGKTPRQTHRHQERH